MRLLHELLLTHPLSHLPIELVAVESAILCSYWNISSDVQGLQRMALNRVLHNVSKSFLRMRVDSVMGIEMPVGLYTGRSDLWKSFTTDLFLNSLGPLLNSLGPLCK